MDRKTDKEYMKIHYKETQYGFEYGAVEVMRSCSDKKRKWIILNIKTKKQHFQIYVTKTGKVRIWNMKKGRTGKEVKA